jgi:hypothetical protein
MGRPALGACGLEFGENGGFGFRGAELVVGHAEEFGEDAGAGFFDFDFGREGAVDGVEGDLFDGLDFGGPAAGQDFREVEAGDLEAV